MDHKDRYDRPSLPILDMYQTKLVVIRLYMGDVVHRSVYLILILLVATLAKVS